MATRREVIASLLGIPLTQLIGCAPRQRAIADIEGRLLGPNFERGHQLRDRVFQPVEWTAPPTTHQVVIVGGGIAGLAAARRLKALGITDFVVLELESSAGGTSISGHGDVSSYPWGAHYVPMPTSVDLPVVRFLDELGVLEGTELHSSGSPRPRAKEEFLIRAPESRLHFRGYFQPGIYPRVGASVQDLEELNRFQAIINRYVGARDAQGARPFSLPSSLSSKAAEFAELDGLSAASWFAQQGFTSARLRWFLEYGTRDDFGASLEDTSAWALLFYHCARVAEAGEESSDFLTWPAGNGFVVDHLVRTIGSARNGTSDRDTKLRLGTMVHRVVPGEDGVSVYASQMQNGSERLLHLRAPHVIMCVPQFVSARIFPRPDVDTSAFHYGSWLVANLTLRGRPPARGTPNLAWDNVIYESPALGYVVATHQSGRDHGRTVWTYYYAMTDSDPRTARQRLMDATLDEWREVIIRDLERAHPSLREYITRIDVWRWAHAMIQPRPGFMFGSARQAAERPHSDDAGRGVYFAHTDLSGMSLFEEAFTRGTDAADAVGQSVRSTRGQ